MRILIATATAGGGHLAAAAALNEAWRAARPEDTVEIVDVVKFFSPLHRKIHADGYVALVERAPELWGLMFNKTDNPTLAGKLNRIRHMFPSQSRRKLARHVLEFKPDAVVCTHYAPLETLGQMRAEHGGASRRRAGKKNQQGAFEEAADRRSESSRETHPLIASVITDFEAHALWMEACVDLYCAAAQETKARLVARGAAPDKVAVTGIPIAAKFSAKPEPKAVRKALGLRDDLPVLLVLSGGFGMGPVAEILTELDKVARDFQTVVVTGRNEELRRDLAVADRKHPSHVLGFATNMHELMAVADLIVTKPGGLTSSEALAMGKPLFILNPIPGQEAANSDFLLERGAACKVNRVEDLPYRLEQLLGSKKLPEMARAAKALGHPDAADVIVRQVTDRVKARVPA